MAADTNDNGIRRDPSPDYFSEEAKERTQARNQKRENARAFLFQRQSAYKELFKKESELAKVVLSDLAKFCRADKSTFDADPRVHALMEGRREVFLRIMEHLELPSEVLWEIKMRKGA